MWKPSSVSLRCPGRTSSGFRTPKRTGPTRGTAVFTEMLWRHQSFRAQHRFGNRPSISKPVTPPVVSLSQFAFRVIIPRNDLSLIVGIACTKVQLVNQPKRHPFTTSSPTSSRRPPAIFWGTSNLPRRKSKTMIWNHQASSVGSRYLFGQGMIAVFDVL